MKTLFDEALSRRLVEYARDPRQGFDLLSAIWGVLDQAADPRAAVTGFERWASRLVSPASVYGLLLEHPRLLRDLILLFGASGYLTDLLARDPEHYALFVAPEPVSALDYARFVRAALRVAARPDRARAALRRIRRRETLRIAWRDLASGAPLAYTVAHISALANALIEGALATAQLEIAATAGRRGDLVSLAVVAMGKLGGCELNYSSDVDLLFVFDSPDPDHDQPYARRLAERTIGILSEESPDGRLYRVDMRLRPEGRYGEIVRSLASYREYYDRWIDTWERQALIKARAVAGSAEVGQRFLALASAAAYRSAPGGEIIEDVRDVKLLTEKRAGGAGSLNVKEGRGTIRDVEFAVQLLQLLFAGQRPALRNANTQRALIGLRRTPLLDREEARSLWDGYAFFRTVEHRLQLKEDLPVRELPAEPSAQRWLARLMGFPDWDRFAAECSRRSEAVRSTCDGIYVRLGAGTEDEADDLRACILALPEKEARDALCRQLRALGFSGIPRVSAALERMAVGWGSTPHPAATRRAFADLAPALFDACAHSADPDEALAGFQRLADRSVLYRQFYQQFSSDPAALADLCALTASSPTVTEILVHHAELLALALDRRELAQCPSPADLRTDLEQRLIGASSRARRLETIRRFRTRHLIRLAAREVLLSGPAMQAVSIPPRAAPKERRAETPCPLAPDLAEGCHSSEPGGRGDSALRDLADTERVERTSKEWTAVAEVCLAAVLHTIVEDLRRQCHWPAHDAAGFAVVGLGRLGGCELQFGSDMDLMFVFEPRGIDSQRYEQLARALLQALAEPGPDGPLFLVDLRLRPEGKSGFIASSEEACRRYYRERAQPWEMQAFLRARPVAGDTAVAERLLAFLEPLVYPAEPPEGWREQVRDMRRRLERERVPREERDRNVKLGVGGLADFEFLVQYLQRLHGAAHPAIRTPNTAEALEALANTGILPKEEARLFADGYGFLNRLRQRLWLCIGEHRANALPTDEVELLRVARSLGFREGEELLARYRETATAVREVFERHLASA